MCREDVSVNVNEGKYQGARLPGRNGVGREGSLVAERPAEWPRQVAAVPRGAGAAPRSGRALLRVSLR